MKKTPPLPDDPKQRLEALKHAHEFDPFSNLLGMRVEHIEENFARITMPFREEITQPLGTVHGGALASLADFAMAIALLSASGPKKRVVTIELKINYLEPVTGGTVIAECKITRKGRSTAYGDIDIRVGDKLVARATSTYMIK